MFGKNQTRWYITPGCFFPHMFGFWQICTGKGTNVWKKPHNYMFANVGHFPHMCGKSHRPAYFPLGYRRSASMSLKWERMEADGILFNQSKQVPGKLIHLMGMMYLAWLEGRSVLKFDLIYCIRSTHMWFDGLKTNMFLRELELWIIIIRCMGPKNILIQYWMISVCKSSMIKLFSSSQSWYIYLIFSESEAQS